MERRGAARVQCRRAERTQIDAHAHTRIHGEKKKRKKKKNKKNKNNKNNNNAVPQNCNCQLERFALDQKFL